MAIVGSVGGDVVHYLSTDPQSITIDKEVDIIEDETGSFHVVCLV